MAPDTADENTAGLGAFLFSGRGWRGAMADEADERSGRHVTRRGVLAGAAALGALGAMKGAPSARPAVRLEKTELALGFIPLTDCAPLVAAAEKGFFAREGLSVRLAREPSWANIRDKVAVGALDGAHMLGAMPVAATLGIDAIAKPMVAPVSFNLGGDAITLSNAVADRAAKAVGGIASGAALDPARLKGLIERDRAAGRRKLVLASVYAFSSHNYLLRYWLAAGGIDPDRDVRFVTVPPPQMVTQLAAGRIDGYCVGEPWNARALSLGIGVTAARSKDVWNRHPEKVLGLTAAWAAAHPNTCQALIRALIQACAWLDANRAEAAHILARPECVGADEATIAAALVGTAESPANHVFFAGAASYPWRSHALWYATQMLRWRQAQDLAAAARAAERTYAPELYRAAAADLGIAAPTIDRKPEGAHAEAWTLTDATAPIAMGADQFIDRRQFDPADLGGYLGELPFAQSRRTREPSSALRG
jgi:nitrate/nitrite transport system substrate-binding protein